MEQGIHYKEKFKRKVVAPFNNGKLLMYTSKGYNIENSAVKACIEKLSKYIKGFLFITILFLLLGSICFSDINENEAINVAVNCRIPPLQFISENDNSITGMHIEIIESIASMNRLKLNYIPFEKNEDCLLALESGAADIVLGQKIGYGNTKDFQSTDELSSSYICMLTSRKLLNKLSDIDSYDNYDAALEYDTIGYSYMTKQRFRKYIVHGNQESVYKDLVESKVSFAVGVKACFEYMLEKDKISDDFIILHSHISSIGYSMLVRKGDKKLLELLNEGMMDIRTSGKYEAILNKWIRNKDLEDILKKNRRIIMFTFIIILVSVVVILLIFSFNRILKHKVNIKTKELHDANVELKKRMIQIESEGRVRNEIIEYSPIGMVLFDNKFKITLMNSIAIEIGGLAEKRFAGHDIREVEVFKNILANINNNTFFSKLNVDNYHCPTTITIGETHVKRSYRYIIYAIRGRDTVNGALMAIEDVTQEDKEKQEFFEKEKNKALNRLIASITHEIKNPLMTIRTAASLIIEQGNNKEVQEAFKKFVPYEIDRINNLLEGLINYARPVKGRKMPFSISKLMEECIELTEIMLERDRIIVEKKIEEELFVYADIDQVKQSLLNLIINSIESLELKRISEPNAVLKIVIEIRSINGDVLIRIWDQGVGMSTIDIKKCTRPFYTTKIAGTGLGLALVKQFIEDNAGTLNINSKKGRYTEISIMLRRYLNEK